MATVTIGETAIFATVRAFLLALLPPGTPVVRGQVNRVPEVKSADFAVMTPIGRTRLSTNSDTWEDSIFKGSIAGTTLNVEGVLNGSVRLGATIFGDGLAAGTVIASGAGTSFVVAPTQTVPAGTSMYAGVYLAQMSTQVDLQIDVHGPASADNTQIIQTMWRDPWACDFLRSMAVSPLYTSEPRQVPFVNGESQFEERWTIDLSLQVNPIVQLSQQFAETVNAFLINVDVTYPP